jgi:hypothetical protein
MKLSSAIATRALLVLGCAARQAAQAQEPKAVICENVRVFNGTSDRLSPPSHVLVVQMATANNAELLALSGLRRPCAGKLGVVEEGALADLLLVDGDP